MSVEPEAPKVWVLVIEHRHGFNHYAHRTERGAHQTLYDYACEWWDELDDEIECEPRPALADFAPNDAVAFYFEHIYEEWYTLEEVALNE